ncbi:sulfotransferase [Parerythrobacter jejuensis]|uniref:Sulfotransferase domain-containing protein n=1 Tax=Parerythrobacter jejuensis TaxID=795812 RepID=A0A845AN32_9SPHN|nr:sulfotransferase [Parerythrobacter jejuensis]MXP31024.1 hypothetical protein [Parerythrobacter jejuensis]MXP33784.1 hypothetical protein [Parerythrobacter jejuensis]
MEPAANPFDLLSRSVIVTGTHYSMTTLTGALLATADEYHLLHEPLNPEPTLSYDSLRPPRWYEYYGTDRFEELAQALAVFLDRNSFPAQVLDRLSSVRTPQEVGQVARYCQRKMPFVLSARPAVLKDPFLAFSARTLQQELGMKVVLTLRHPAGFAESMIRKAGQFDFSDLASQHSLLETVPDEADEICRFAASNPPAIEQAALLWRVIYGFAARYLVPDARTMTVRQEDMVSNTQAAIDRLFAFAHAQPTPSTGRLVAKNLQAQSDDHAGGSYIRRDGAAATNKWRERLGADDIALLQEQTGELAARLGYNDFDWSH